MFALSPGWDAGHTFVVLLPRIMRQNIHLFLLMQDTLLRLYYCQALRGEIYGFFYGRLPHFRECYFLPPDVLGQNCECFAYARLTFCGCHSCGPLEQTIDFPWQMQDAVYGLIYGVQTYRGTTTDITRFYNSHFTYAGLTHSSEGKLQALLSSQWLSFTHAVLRFLVSYSHIFVAKTSTFFYLCNSFFFYPDSYS